MVGYSPPDFLLARWLYVFAAVLFFVAVWWLVVFKSNAPKCTKATKKSWHRTGAGLTCGLIAGLVAAQGYVSYRERRFESMELKKVDALHATQLLSEPTGRRRLTPWQKVTLTTTLANYPGWKVLILAYPDDETQHYANELGNCLRDARWVVEGPHEAPKDQAEVDIELFVSETYWAKPAPAAYQSLRDALKFIHVKMRTGFQVMPDVSPDHVVMWVGPQSPDSFNPDNVAPPVTQMPCLSSLPFQDTAMDSAWSDIGRFARRILVNVPNGTHKVRLYLTGPVTGTASENTNPLRVAPADRLMPHNETLDVELVHPLKTNGPLLIVAISSDELRVKCVDYVDSQW